MILRQEDERRREHWKDCRRGTVARSGQVTGVITGYMSVGRTQTSSSKPYAIRSSSLAQSATSSYVECDESMLTFDLVLAHVDVRRRRRHVACEVVHHLVSL